MPGLVPTTSEAGGISACGCRDDIPGYSWWEPGRYRRPRRPGSSPNGLSGWHNGGVSIGEELLEERRRRRRAGDPRFTEADREYARRLTTGDLVGEFQAALDGVSAADPLLGGDPDPDTDPSP